MRRGFYFLLLFLLGARVALPAQSAAAVEQLEAALPALSGAERVEVLLSLAEVQLQRERYKQSLARSEEAETLAQTLRRSDLRARALNFQGKALEKLEKRTWFGKSKAISKFTQSLSLAQGDAGLSMDNLEHLRHLAARAGDEEMLAEWEEKMNIFREDMTPHVIVRVPTPPRTGASAGGGNAHPPAPPSTGEEPVRLNNEYLANEQQLRQESAALQAQLAAKEMQIQEMNQAQMKTELLVMQQRQVLDSLQFAQQFDSLSRAHVHLELREAKANRRFFNVALISLLAIAGGALFFLFRARQHAGVLRRMNAMLRSERERSETLLLNILPGLVAEELKQRGRTEARYYDDVSVLFADFVNFSGIAEQLTPQQLVGELDTCFQAFDLIIAKHGLEKIKTIGDAYMCAGGLFADPRSLGGNRLRDMVAAALEMQRWLAAWNAERDAQGRPRFDARIGIHRGPVVAGVVGSRKFAFDIWGDTVNIAARVEAASEGGKINVSGKVYEIIKEYYPCDYRGRLPAKNKGEIDMYYVQN